MFDIYDLLILFITGSVGGVLAGLLGIGGGLVYVVAFTYYLQFFGLSDVEIVKYLVSNSIFGVFFAGVSGTIKQIRTKNFYFREVIITAVPGILAALITSFFIVKYDWYSKERFAVFFILILLIFALRMFWPIKPKGLVVTRSDLPPVNFIITGFFSGMLSALSGLGGGIILIPILAGMMRLKIVKASSISLGMMPFFALAMSLYYGTEQLAPIEFAGTIGYLIIPLVLPVALGVVIFAPLGVRIAHKLPGKAIRIIFGVVMLLVIVKMSYQFYF